MSLIPIITFKAGLCDVDSSSKPYKIKPLQKPGYICLYSEDDLIHFCWRPRDVPLDQSELDLVMVPMDAHFVPYDTKSPANATSKTNGRIFALKFSSSSQRHLFWLQSKPQGRSGDPAWLSPRDRKIGDIVDRLLQGHEVDVTRELSSVRDNNNDSHEPGDEDATMRDADDPPHGGSGGAGADATGADIREEGEEAREGGADGARAAGSGAPDAAAAVRDFLASLKGTPGLGGGASQGKLYPLLNDLLDRSVTVPLADSASEGEVDNLLSYLPPAVLVLALRGAEGDSAQLDLSADAAAAAKAAMTLEQKRALLKKVLRSPQFNQSLLSLTNALREGGLPSVSEALGIRVENGGHVRGGNVPLGGGDAVEAFVEGIKKSVEKK